MEPTRDEGFIVNEGILGVIGVCNRRIEFLSVQQWAFERGWKIVLLFLFGAHLSAASREGARAPRAFAAQKLLERILRRGMKNRPNLHRRLASASSVIGHCWDRVRNS
jgi:hypothetical protein